MLLPQGLEEYITKDHVLKLNKLLYGLKQAPFLWHEKVHSTIQRLGFSSNKADPCLYSKYVSGDRLNRLKEKLRDYLKKNHRAD
jgi:hypothetical protein